MDCHHKTTKFLYWKKNRALSFFWPWSKIIKACFRHLMHPPNALFKEWAQALLDDRKLLKEKKSEQLWELQSYLSAVEEAFLWQITAKELLPGAISCLISHATRLLGFTARKLMPDWNHTLQRRNRQKQKENQKVRLIRSSQVRYKERRWGINWES